MTSIDISVFKMATLWRRVAFMIPRITCLTSSTRSSLPPSYICVQKCSITKDSPKLKPETVTIHFLHPDGKKSSAKAKIGDNLLDVIIENDVDIDGYGACEGTLACSTCHLIFKKDNYDQIPNKHTDEELDMLDLAYDLTDTSRLGCQVIINKNMDGWEITVPSTISDAREA